MELRLGLFKQDAFLQIEALYGFGSDESALRVRTGLTKECDAQSGSPGQNKC